MAGLPTPANDLTNTGHLVGFSFKMSQEAYSTETRVRYERSLRTLINRGADLTNPESVKNVISMQKWQDGTKQSVTNAVLLFYKFNGITAQLPNYKIQPKIAFIPTEAEIDQLISGCKHRLATFLQTLKETACRYGEAYALEWTDFDSENQTITINHPEKGSLPRQPHISTQLQAMINQLPRTSNKIFDYGSKDIIRKNFQRARRRIAKNTGNPRLLQIHFHTFRHWKASTFYHDTNNVIKTMQLLGHKCLNNTQRYIQLFPDLPDKYVTEISYTLEEDKKLLDAGYEFQTERDGAKLYRKRK